MNIQRNRNKKSIIRKSKRCKFFKRCVHITKTSSTNGIPPLKRKIAFKETSL